MGFGWVVRRALGLVVTLELLTAVGDGHLRFGLRGLAVLAAALNAPLSG
jgi:hypothetical protein